MTDRKKIQQPSEGIPRPLSHATAPLPLPPAPSAGLFRPRRPAEGTVTAPAASGRPREGRAIAVAIAIAVLLLLALLLAVHRSGQDSTPVPEVGQARGGGGFGAPLDPASNHAGSADISQLIGQHLIVGWRGTSSPPRWLLKDVRRGRVGGVILFSENAPAPTVDGFAQTTKLLQSAARAGGGPPLLIAMDQEGGEVRRLDGPPHLAPEDMGSSWSPVFRQARAAGRALDAAGVTVNLAPVADLSTPYNAWESSRLFGSRPADVAVAVGAFVAGLRSAGVASAVKHYPGLGYAEASTDAQAVTIDASADQLEEGEAPFTTGIAAGAQMVMVSSAVYPTLDPANPAVTSPVVMRRLRRSGFKGVVVSDDLGAPAFAGDPDVGVRAIAAGCDLLLLVGRPGPLISELRQALADGQIDRRSWLASTRRILRLKKKLSATDLEKGGEASGATEPRRVAGWPSSPQ